VPGLRKIAAKVTRPACPESALDALVATRTAHLESADETSPPLPKAHSLSSKRLGRTQQAMWLEGLFLGDRTVDWFFCKSFLGKAWRTAVRHLMPPDGRQLFWKPRPAAWRGDS